jgi:D-amino-acid dehydrogenase
VIGRAAHPNLIVNAGHGHLGFTLACGSAQIVTDLVRSQDEKIGPYSVGAAS